MAILSSNENPFGPSPMAVAAMQAELTNIYRYTYPTVMKFAEKIAAMEAEDDDRAALAPINT